jgi:hypothetical protein
MKRIKQLLVMTVAVLVALLAIRYYCNQRDRALALPVIVELGGKMSAIPFEPFGTEYRIVFRNRKLTRDDLDRLVAIHPLANRNWVGMKFENSGLSPADVQYVREILPTVHLLPLIDDNKKQ